jgi:hypothetical protein
VKISDDKFVKYFIDFPYFGLNDNQHDFILFTEADSSSCKTNGITICSADVAIYNSPTLTCESSLFFQTVTDRHMCRKSLLLNHQTPTLRRHKATWLYHLPESTTVTLRCYVNGKWITYSETLSGNGVISDATGCSISTTKMHTLPELHETSATTLDTLHQYVPEKISIVDNQETQILEKISSELIQQLEDVKSRVMTPPRTLDLDSITNVHRTSLQRDQQTLAHDNYCDYMRTYDCWNPFLFPPFLIIPQTFTMYFYTETFKPSHRTTNYSLIFFYTTSRT